MAGFQGSFLFRDKSKHISSRGLIGRQPLCRAGVGCRSNGVESLGNNRNDRIKSIREIFGDRVKQKGGGQGLIPANLRRLAVAVGGDGILVKAKVESRMSMVSKEIRALIIV